MLEILDTKNLLEKIFMNMPKYLAMTQLIEIPPPFVPHLINKRLKDSYQDSAKPRFIKWLALNHPIQLSEILRTDDIVIEQMQKLWYREVRPYPTRLERYAVDHIIPLSSGGTNDFENFSLVPNKLNFAKSHFEAAQIKFYGGKPLILHTLAPLHQADGTYVKIIPSLEP